MSTEYMEEIIAMPKDLYWEWRTTCEETAHAKTKLELRKSLHVTLQMQVKLAEYAVKQDVLRVKSAEEHVTQCENEGVRIKERIEKELGIDFSDCVVGDDLVIRKLDQGKDL